MTLDDLTQALPSGLFVMGLRHGPPDETTVLLGADTDFWPIFAGSPEYSDGLPDPVDRWSKRMIRPLATQFGGTADFPSDGPPYAPFIAWAMNTGQFHQSPTGMMVHPVAGLMISIRGALHLPVQLPQPAAAEHPCTTCTAKPCVEACPVDALSAQAAYDVPTCKAYLDTPAGAACMQQGCHVRTACPISQGFDRAPAQNAFHMRSFHTPRVPT